MSRGLSQNQRRILGLALAFNRELHGGTYRPNIPATPAGDRYREPYRALLLSESAQPWDLQQWMAVHFVMGVPLKVWGPASQCRFTHSGRNPSLKVSATRAITGLRRRELLVAHIWHSPVTWEGRVIVDGREATGKQIESYGYALTPAGLAAAAESSFAGLLDTVCVYAGARGYALDVRAALRTYAKTSSDNSAESGADTAKCYQGANRTLVTLTKLSGTNPQIGGPVTHSGASA